MSGLSRNYFPVKTTLRMNKFSIPTNLPNLNQGPNL